MVWREVRGQERFLFVNTSKVEEVVVGADMVEEGGPQSDIWSVVMVFIIVVVVMKCV